MNLELCLKQSNEFELTRVLWRTIYELSKFSLHCSNAHLFHPDNVSREWETRSNNMGSTFAFSSLAGDG